MFQGIATKIAIFLHKFGGWVLALMMFFTAVDVFLRNALNRPILGAFEITECMMAVLVASGLAYVSVGKNQIRVQLVFTLLPEQVQRVLNIINDILGLSFCSLVAWRTLVYLKGEIEVNTRMGILLIPTPPFIAVVAFGWLLLALVLLKQLFESIKELKK